MEALLQDIRYGWRMLAKNPGFTTVAILTLALGIGANTAIFSIVNAVLLRPLPFRQPDQLVAVRTTEAREHVQNGPASYPDFLDWRAQNHVFQGMSAFFNDSATLTGRGEAARLRTAEVSANLFSVLGVSPMLGRDFRPEEDQAGAAFPVIISHRAWLTRFDSDPNILGQKLTLDGRDYTVVGVMPAGFQFPVQSDPVELWSTMANQVTPRDKDDTPLGVQRGAHFLRVIARLKPQVAMGSAQAEMVSIQNALNHQYPENRPKSISVIPELSQVVGDMRPALLILFGAVGFVLLIACANVANLLLARATARQKEITIRSALGARRWAIVRQLLTESVLLSLAGAIPGVMLAVWGIAACTRLAPGKLPRVAESGVNLEVLGFTLLVAVITGILFGLVPALHVSRSDLNRSLNEGGRGGSDSTRRSRIRAALVVSEVGIAMVLLVGAGLLLQSLFRLRQVSPGFVADHVLTFGLEPPDSRYSDEQRPRFYRELLQRIETIPGVKSAAAVFPLPMSGVGANTSFEVEGRPVPQAQRPATDVSLVSPEYFQTMGIPLLQGRVFTEHDDAQAPAVAIVNETFARRFFPGENLLGKRIRPSVWHAKGDGPMFEIVGVVGDVKHGNLSRPADPEVYQPDAQNSYAQLAVTVRTSLPPESMVSSLREQVQALDKNLPLINVKTMGEYVGDSMAAPRFDTVLLGIFASLALLLTAIGLYGVISYSVTQRMHEMGIRIALGAQSTDILRMILRQGLVLAIVGVGFGLAASLGTARIIASLLYGIRATDIGTFVAIAAVLMGVALVASYVPARQATKVDPMVALRYE